MAISQGLEASLDIGLLFLQNVMRLDVLHTQSGSALRAPVHCVCGQVYPWQYFLGHSILCAMPVCLLRLAIPLMCTVSSHGSSKGPLVLSQADNQYEAWCLV